MHTQSLHSCQTLCNPIDYSLPGSTVRGISQARILERVAISFSRGSSWPRDQIHVSCTTGGFLPTELLGKPYSSSAIFQLLLYCLREKAMATHSSTLAWEIPWTEEPGRLQSMGSRRVGHDWETSLFIFMHWRREWQPTPVFLPGESQEREPGGLPSIGSHRVGHDWCELAAAARV